MRESRYKSSPVQTEQYLLACVRYIELNPVRARLVASPEDYPWSSYQQHRGEGGYPWLDNDPYYLTLGKSPGERADNYARFVNDSIQETEWALIRKAVQRGQLTGDNRFVDEVESLTGRRVEHRNQGRPRSKGK